MYYANFMANLIFQLDDDVPCRHFLDFIFMCCKLLNKILQLGCPLKNTVFEWFYYNIGIYFGIYWVTGSPIYKIFVSFYINYMYLTFESFLIVCTRYCFWVSNIAYFNFQKSKKSKTEKAEASPEEEENEQSGDESPVSFLELSFIWNIFREKNVTVLHYSRDARPLDFFRNP